MDADRTHKLTLGGRPRRIALLAITALLAALAIPSAASATRGLITGFGDSEEYQQSSDSDRALWMGRTADAGAGIVRLGVEWPAVASGAIKPADPTNPASTDYDFSSVDPAVREASAKGLKILLSVNHAPTWAEGPNRPASAAVGTWQPNPSDVADFMQAVASRYSGSFNPGTGGTLPAVQDIEVWDEPNSGDWLTPQFQGKTFTGAALYRDILNASYKAIKSVNPSIQVVVGGTDPYGDPPGGPYPASGGRERPVQFWEHVFCLREQKVKKKKKGKKAAPKLVRDPACTGKASFDVFAHHPIDNTGGGPLKSGPSRWDASTPDLGRVVTVLRAAEKQGTATGSGRHPVWVTEFWWDSKPPNPVGAPLATQARYIQQSMYLFWKAGASAAINFQIVDSNLRPNVHAGFQAGVYFMDGRPKPSLTAFKFPFVTNRTTPTKLEAWGKAPESGKLLIQRQQGSRWLTVKKLQVSKGGVFDTTLRLRGKQRLRASVGSSKSLVWKQAATGSKSSSGGGAGTTDILLIAAGALLLILVVAGVLRRRQVVRRRERRGPRIASAVTI
ncbi:MAG TPA: hypothetical protein VIJ36_07925 [Thermoanaerobaculia bacterium]